MPQALELTAIECCPHSPARTTSHSVGSPHERQCANEVLRSRFGSDLSGRYVTVPGVNAIYKEYFKVRCPLERPCRSPSCPSVLTSRSRLSRVN